MKENQEVIDQKFSQIINKPKFKERRPPAKFPELRYLWGITLLGTFVLMVVASIVQTFLGI